MFIYAIQAGTKWSAQDTLYFNFVVDIDLIINIILLVFQVANVILEHTTQTFNTMKLLVRLVSLYITGTLRRKLFYRDLFQRN